MKNNIKKISMAVILLFIIATSGVLLFAINAKIIKVNGIYSKNAPASIKLNFDENIFQRIINNPGSINIEVTQIIQEPSRYVEKNTNTETESMLITLNGEGEARLLGGKYNNRNLKMSKNEIVYIPPGTNFTVFNTGKNNIKYLLFKINLT